VARVELLDEDGVQNEATLAHKNHQHGKFRSWKGKITLRFMVSVT